MKLKLTFLSVVGLALMSSNALAAEALASIKATTEGSLVSGGVHLTEKGEGLEIIVQVVNVSPGKHGFHIHENGSCEEMGKAAGGHYNPDQVQHGLITRDGFTNAHCGDFGNIDVGPDGTGTVTLFVPGLTLTGEKYNVAGKAVILHEKEDDFGQPTGNAGGRIGCGIIEIMPKTIKAMPIMPGAKE